MSDQKDRFKDWSVIAKKDIDYKFDIHYWVPISPYKEEDIKMYNDLAWRDECYMIQRRFKDHIDLLVKIKDDFKSNV